MIRNRDILCISTQDWDDLWTRKHRFMQRFARQGNKVLYIEAPASMVSLNIIKNDPRRIFRWVKGPREIEDNLYVGTLPLLLPFFQMSTFINNINNLIIALLLKYWIRRLNFRNFILWTYTPFSDNIAKRMSEIFTIYECVDEFSDSKGLVKPNVVKKMEERLLKKADLVIVTHKNLFQSKKDLAKNIYLISNAADIEHFKKAYFSDTPKTSEMNDIPRPIIGFLGTVQYWIDLDLIKYLAISKPEWSIVLIGPIGRLAKIEKIKHIPNIHLLGRKNYLSLPFYIKAWDVCINPYVLDKTAENCSPLKLYEYLATGKPVVSVDMPEARKFDGLIKIGLDYRDFLEKIETILNQLPESPDTIEARIKAIEGHSWESRFQELEKALEPHLGST